MPESEHDISIDEIVSVAQAALRGQSLKDHAATIRQYMDEALFAFSLLDDGLRKANLAHEANGSNAVTPEDRQVVEYAAKYVAAENRMLHVLLRFAEEGGTNSGGIF